MGEAMIEFPFQSSSPSGVSPATVARTPKASARHKTNLMPAYLHRQAKSAESLSADSARNAARKPASKNGNKGVDEFTSKPDMPWAQFTILHLRAFLPPAPSRFSMPDLLSALRDATLAGWIAPVPEYRMTSLIHRLFLQGVVNRHILRESIGITSHYQWVLTRDQKAALPD